MLKIDQDYLCEATISLYNALVRAIWSFEESKCFPQDARISSRKPNRSLYNGLDAKMGSGRSGQRLELRMSCKPHQESARRVQ
jgi:hypothetical protein